MTGIANGFLLPMTGYNLPSDFTLEFIVIAGGGHNTADWNEARGGGGAGGYISSVIGESSGGGASALTAPTLTVGSSTYAVTVGATGSNSRLQGSDSSSTAFDHHSVAGGDYRGNGGSGGGGGINDGYTSGGAGTTGQGYAGGNGTWVSSICATFPTMSMCLATRGGGGGGAGAAGSGFNGGDGVQSSITGTPTYYAGGGHGMNAGMESGIGGKGYYNYGGGGVNKGKGLAGAVLLRYPSFVAISNPGGGLTMTTSVVGTNNVTVITAGSGNISFSHP